MAIALRPSATRDGSGVDRVGNLAHIFMTIGWMLLLLATLEARDAAVRPPSGLR